MRAHLIALLIIAAVLPQSCSRANDAPVTAEVMEAGAFKLGPGQPGARETHFITQTHNIDARLGTGFGFRWKLTNVPDRPTFDVQTAVTHPPFRTKRGELETHYELVTTVPVRDGVAMSVTGYNFDHPEELAPGVWTFTHSLHGKPLVTQSFTVRAAAR
jgi:hypothetical protein